MDPSNKTEQVFGEANTTEWVAYPQFEEALTRTVTETISRELPNCFLAVVFDVFFRNSQILSTFSKLPNTKQFLQFSLKANLEQVIWSLNLCAVVVFLLAEPSKLLQFCNHEDHQWNYHAKYIIVTSSREHLRRVFTCKKAKKTEYLLGLIPSSEDPKTCLKFTNQIFSPDPIHLVKSSSKYVFREDKLKNFNNSEIKVATFEWKPNVIYSRYTETPELYGMDIIVIEAAASAYNFRIKYIEPPPNEFWGVPLPNGSHTGLVGMVQRGDTDIGVSNVFLTFGRKDLVDYSHSLYIEPTCFLGTTPLPRPRWQSLLRPFQLNTWLSFAVILGIVAIILNIFGAVNKKILGNGELTPGIYCLLIAIKAYLREPVEIIFTKSNSLKVFLAFFWIYCLIVTTAYSSNLTASLTIQKPSKAIETILELRQSSLDVVALGPFFKAALTSSTDKNLQILANRFVAYDNLEDIFSDVLERRGMMLQNLAFLEYATTTKLFKGQKEPRRTLRIMKECFSPYNVGMYFNKNSLYREKINAIILRTNEFGLFRKGFLDALERSRQEAKLEFADDQSVDDSAEEETSGQGFVSLSLGHLQGIFLIYLMANAFATISFVFEILLSKKNKT